MRSLFKLSLFAAIALLFAAGSAMALDVKWSGNIGAGFGQLTLGATGDNDGDGDKTGTGEDADARTEFITSYEANIRATVGGGPLTAIWRLRSRGHQSGTQGSTEAGASTVTVGNTSGAGLSYAELWWKPADAFTVGFGRFQGQAWSQPMSGTYLILNPLGAPEYFMNWTGIDGLDLEFNAGVVQVGVGIATECRPSCGPGTPTFGTQSIVPHLAGKFGDIGLRVQAPQTSAKVRVGSTGSQTDESVKGAGYQVGVSWSGMQGVYVGFDYQSFTDTANDKVSSSAKEDQQRTGMGLRVDFAGFQLGYHDLKTTNASYVKDAETQGTFMKLSYTLKVGDGIIVPEVTTRKTVAAKDADAVNDMLIRLVGNVGF
jgi:hypothetical protein